MKSVFISHSFKDKPIARQLASDLAAEGIRVWVDEAEIQIGDNLVQKISEGIERSDYILVILSRNSVSSSWVQKEVSLALSRESDEKSSAVLPVLIDDVKLPAFVQEKKYVDLSSAGKYEAGVRDLVDTVTSPRPADTRLSDVIDVPDLAEEIAKEVAKRLRTIPGGTRIQNDPPRVSDPKLVFVIMSFAPDMEPVFEGIRAAAEEHGLRAERVKDVPGDYRITEKVLEMIGGCFLVVADLSHERPNVYFELGYARGLGKTVITTAREGTHLHFDVKDWTCIPYNDSRTLEKRLSNRFEYELKQA